MDKVYVIFCDTGCFSEATSWGVASYANKDKADSMCETLNQWAETNGFRRKCIKFDSDMPVARKIEQAKQSMPIKDHQFECSEGGVEYCVAEVPFRDE